MSVRLPTRLESLTSKEVEWVHLARNMAHDIEFLGKRFHFHPIDLRETLPPLQRPKLVVRDNYLFLILLFPVYDRETKTVGSTEVDFFIEPGRIVTVNNDSLPILRTLFQDCKQNRDVRADFFGEDASFLLYNILAKLIASTHPILLHLSNDVDELEKALFHNNQKSLIMDVLRIKTNIVNSRKAMQGHTRVLQSLIRDGSAHLPMRRMKPYFEELTEQSREIWEMLELEYETIKALHETNRSLLEFKTNEVMKTLTVISVVVFPLTLIATLFAMDVGGIPFHNDAFGFLKILLILASIGIVMVGIFKKKGWV